MIMIHLNAQLLETIELKRRQTTSNIEVKNVTPC